MSQSPELQQAYQMIKTGQRQEAGALLKAYLSAHPKDADGWWLMAHAASKPEIVQKCLERVLQINPDHAKAKEKLARMTAPAPIVPPPPAIKKETAVPDSFEAFAAQPLSDVGADDPFSTPQPVDAARPKPPKPKKGGPRLASDDFAAAPVHNQAGVEKVIGWAVLAIALVVLLGGGLYIANSQGWLGGGDKDEDVTLVRMDAGSFTVLYPKGWDNRCETESQGYPVCGVANHKVYNDVDWYAHQNVDLTVFSQMFAESLFGGGEDLPDRRISIVVMDVPQSSSAYDAKSLAKTNYEYASSGWMMSASGKADYDHSEITIDGHKAYYYHYYSSDPVWEMREAAYDVYIEHDGIIFWMVVSISTPLDEKVPDSMIQEIIKSIDIK